MTKETNIGLATSLSQLTVTCLSAMWLMFIASPARSQSEQRVAGADLGWQPTDAPAEASWHYTERMTRDRTRHTATLLRNGKVLIVGGRNTVGDELNSAELYDPATKTWTLTGSLAAGRFNHTATLLPSHKVLVTGGSNGSIYLINSAE